jgi:LPXTG-motif cell wall-anchored protein
MLATVAAGTLMIVSSASAASARQQPGAPQITSPASQSGVTQGDTVAVTGDGCSPDTTVDIEFNTSPVGSTQSDAGGAFSQSITVPVYAIPGDVEEASEASIAAVCDGQRASVVVAVTAAQSPQDPADAGSDATAADDAATLPETGAGSTVVLSALGLGLVTAGTVLARRFRVRGAGGTR